MNKYEQIAQLIRNASNIVILTGAGMSTESGVKDFRSKDGLSQSTYEGYYPETILSDDFFYNKPDVFYDYLEKFLNVEGIEPNKGHYIISELEKDKNITVITQNIDSLHQKAGSENVIELHGNMQNTSCTKCDKEENINQIFKNGHQCACGGIYKTEVVLYGENVPRIEEAFRKAESTDLLIVLGTSLNVYPAASIPEAYGISHKPIIIINKDNTHLRERTNVIEINDEIGKTLEEVVKYL